MLVLKENERLYLRTWEYNACRIITKLAEIAIENGGRVKPQKKVIIYDRNLEETKTKLSNRIDFLKELEKKSHKDIRVNAITEKEKELKKLELINNDPIQVTHTNYISFIINDTYYYYEIDDNPFFEFYYIKTPIIDNKHSCDTLSAEDKKEWLYDCYLKVGCTETDIKKASESIFNMLVSSDNSIIRLDKKRVRVPNSYNNSYHYENVYEKERFASVNF